MRKALLLAIFVAFMLTIVVGNVMAAGPGPCEKVGKFFDDAGRDVVKHIPTYEQVKDTAKNTTNKARGWIKDRVK